MIISDPALTAALQRLYAEYPVATARAAAALKTDPAGHLLEEEGLRRSWQRKKGRLLSSDRLRKSSGPLASHGMPD